MYVEIERYYREYIRRRLSIRYFMSRDNIEFKYQCERVTYIAIINTSVNRETNLLDRIQWSLFRYETSNT